MPPKLLHHIDVRPPAILEKSPNPKTLERARKTLDRFDLDSSSELTASRLRNLHPLLREGLAPHPTGRDLAAKKSELEAASSLLAMGISGMRFMRAEGILGAEEPNPKVPGHHNTILTFSPKALPESAQLGMSAYVGALPHDEYVLHYYGMQNSHIPKNPPAWLRRFYHLGAPTLGLGLITNSLREAGAKKVFVPTTDYAKDRKGAKRTQVRLEVTRLIDSGYSELDDLVSDWHDLTDKEVFDILRKKPLTHRLQQGIFDPKLLQRYYGTIPSLFRHAIQTRKVPAFYLQHTSGTHPLHEIDLDQIKPLSEFMAPQPRT